MQKFMKLFTMATFQNSNSMLHHMQTLRIYVILCIHNKPYSTITIHELALYYSGELNNSREKKSMPKVMTSYKPEKFNPKKKKKPQNQRTTITSLHPTYFDALSWNLSTRQHY